MLKLVLLPVRPPVNYGCDYVFPVTQQEGASSKASAHKANLKCMWEPAAHDMRSCDPSYRGRGGAIENS